MTIFADTSALVSLYSKTDSNHAKAVQITRSYKNNSLIISKYIFAETVTILSQREGKKQSIKVGEVLKNVYIWADINQGIENSAWEIFKKQTSKNVGFIDCTTIALYSDGAFDKLFTFDTDFIKNKVPVLD